METRILIHENSGWIALPYIWNEEQNEAYLEITGGNKKTSWVDKNNNYQSIDYIIPNMNQCKGCHVNSGFLKTNAEDFSFQCIRLPFDFMKIVAIA